MTVCTLTSKGQLVLPVSLRRKFGLAKGTRLAVSERAGEIVIRPVTAAYIDSLCGSLEVREGDTPATEELLREHAREARQEGTAT
jgi:AbrB family looped-hinge helix DNA binding protein